MQFKNWQRLRDLHLKLLMTPTLRAGLIYHKVIDARDYHRVEVMTWVKVDWQSCKTCNFCANAPPTNSWGKKVFAWYFIMAEVLWKMPSKLKEPGAHEQSMPFIMNMLGSVHIHKYSIPLLITAQISRFTTFSPVFPTTNTYRLHMRKIDSDE